METETERGKQKRKCSPLAASLKIFDRKHVTVTDFVAEDKVKENVCFKSYFHDI